jgi:membrane-anchored protein YejM (alkaline phosphatase superfamily)
VLTELETLQYDENTVVILNADHGYQLGEHSMWEK